MDGDGYGDSGGGGGYGDSGGGYKDDGGGYNDDNDDSKTRGPGYNDNCRDDNPFDPTNRNKDPFSSPEDIEEKYRNERERATETDVDEIKPFEDDDASSIDGRGGALAVMLGSSLANSMADGLPDKHEKLLNGKTPFTTFGIDHGDGHSHKGSSCAEDCVYCGVLCCQCSIL